MAEEIDGFEFGPAAGSNVHSRSKSDEERQRELELEQEEEAYREEEEEAEFQRLLQDSLELETPHASPEKSFDRASATPTASESNNKSAHVKVNTNGKGNASSSSSLSSSRRSSLEVERSQHAEIIERFTRSVNIGGGVKADRF